MTASKRKSTIITLVLILLPITWWVGSEFYYARTISPEGVLTVGDFVKRFGKPRLIRVLERDGKEYYELSGRIPSVVTLSFPSSPPAYVFDEQGRFVTWCRDPGDQPDYRKEWPFMSTNRVDPGVFNARFQL